MTLVFVSCSKGHLYQCKMRVLVALLGSLVLALPAQLLSVCTQVQQPLVALLGSMVLALPAQLLCLPLSLSLLIHCVGKANMAGAAPVAQTLVRAKPNENKTKTVNCHNPNMAGAAPVAQTLTCWPNAAG